MHSLPLNAETITMLGNLKITNSLLASWLAMVVLIVFGIVIRIGLNRRYQGWTGGIALIAEQIFGIFENILGWEATKKIGAVLATFFVFILMNNWLGLLPGFGSLLIVGASGERVPLFRAATTDINVTLSLAILSVVTIQIWGIAQQGLPYVHKFINFSGPWYLKPINFFVGILEIISEGAKILSFGFRLFGNIFAGEVLLTIMFGLVPMVVPGIFYGLELFVGFIQAFVFVMLTAVFLKMAGESHSESH